MELKLIDELRSAAANAARQKSSAARPPFPSFVFDLKRGEVMARRRPTLLLERQLLTLRKHGGLTAQQKGRQLNPLGGRPALDGAVAAVATITAAFRLLGPAVTAARAAFAEVAPDINAVFCTNL